MKADGMNKIEIKYIEDGLWEDICAEDNPWDDVVFGQLPIYEINLELTEKKVRKLLKKGYIKAGKNKIKFIKIAKNKDIKKLSKEEMKEIKVDGM